MTAAQAITVYTLAGGIAGGLGQIILSKKLGNEYVKGSTVVLAAGATALTTLLATAMIRKIQG